MNEDLLRLYDEELKHLRLSAAEFGRRYPDAARRLQLGLNEPADPYVERLLEGFAYLTARIRHTYESEFPRITQTLLESVAPQYLSPLPAMTVVQVVPDLEDPGLAEGFEVPRHSTLVSSRLYANQQTRCQFRTAHPLTLWPIRVASCEYLGRDLRVRPLPSGEPWDQARAGIRLRLEATGDLSFDQIPIECLRLFVRGSFDLAVTLYELVFAEAVGLVVSPTEAAESPRWVLRDAGSIRRVGFEPEESLLPPTYRMFDGFRLLREFFAFPRRFLFFDLWLRDPGSGVSLAGANTRSLDVTILLKRGDASLERELARSKQNRLVELALHCTPAINLFEKTTNRIPLSEAKTEFPVVPDRTRPLDYEVYGIEQVDGIGREHSDRQTFLPFYAASEVVSDPQRRAYYAIYRRPRMLTELERKRGPRSQYLGTEVYLSLVDAAAAPYRPDLVQLAVRALCTNRDLPRLTPFGHPTDGVEEGGRAATWDDFTLELGGPVRSVRCVTAVTSPMASHARGTLAWRLISHLSLNYLSLVDGPDGQGASALQEMLKLYAPSGESDWALRLIEGIRSVSVRGVTRRVMTRGGPGFARGLLVGLLMEESQFARGGAFLLGSVLERFFAKYATVNSFAQTEVQSTDRGQVIQWPVRPGQRAVL